MKTWLSADDNMIGILFCYIALASFYIPHFCMYVPIVLIPILIYERYNK